MPPKGSICGFKNPKRSIKVHFVVFAGFECLIVPISGAKPDSGKSFTSKDSEHVSCGFCYKFVRFDEKNFSKRSNYLSSRTPGRTSR